ncbi:MAG: hypothetical protein RL329_2266 [Bacteroidota bacterium]|jgi:hypothetical protein
MLLPDNIHPENTIYYNGAMVLQALQKRDKQPLLDLFQQVKQQQKMSFPIFILSLDWLYLIQIAILNQNGEVQLCS